jgi:predicted kinase
MLIDSDQTIAEYFGVGLDTKNMTSDQIDRMVPAQNQLVVMQLTGEITKAKATSAIKTLSKTKFKLTKKQIKASIDSKEAAINTIEFSKSPERKGMSTFDFDDTLAKTKSGVRVVIPNKTNEPKPKHKVIFLAGGAGSGKGNVIKKLGLERDGFKIVNSDISLEWLKKNNGLPADMKELTKEQRSTLGKLGHQARGIARSKMMKYQGNADGVVVDGTGGSIRSMQKLVDEFKAKGYDVSMLFVDTSLDTALARNRARAERSLLDKIVIRNHEAVQGNKSSFRETFGNRFMEVNTDNLTQNSPMPQTLTDKVNDFVYSYEKQRLDAEEFATRGSQILEEGGKFDFSEFNEVVDGTPGPLLNKAKQRAAKYGTKDMFVLTARPQESAQAIQQFLKSQGLDIPIKNITGLADSTGEAKAMWMVEKYAEGYNDMYFVDDAFQNVEAVQNVLSQLDVKSEVVQAKAKFSKSASADFNKIIEESKGVNAGRVISQAEAKKMGKNKGWWRMFVPPSAEDFKGLLYRFLGTGKVGERHMKFFKENLLDPFAKGIRAWNIYKQNMVNEYKQLKKNFENVTKSLNKKVPGTSFTVDAAIRVYLWKKAGYTIPGLDAVTEGKLNDYVLNNVEIRNFADILGSITRVKEGYIKPSENWSLEAIATDLNNVVNKVGRKQFLAEYLANAEAIFTPENMNKIEALYGTNFREALENIMYRMENGGNRKTSTDKNVNRMYNWINGSIGAIMFFNMRSAILQTISTVNFINWNDNNIFKASAAFANQPQFWRDFAMLFNSPQLRQRRAGIQIDVSASELSRAFADGRGTPQSVINWLLEKGFTPTQIADSFAIAFGGASFIRNRIKTYTKKGMSEAKAKEQAMLDFQEIAEETQQSSREDLVSQQQAGPLGRLILAFQNVTMQYTRLTKKALSDLINRRGDTKTNISKIIYYGAVQNIVFGALQTALVFVLFGKDEEEDKVEEKTQRVFNGALDSLLRGTGIYGAIVATIKNTVKRYQKEKEKGWGRDDGRIILEALNLSPPIGAKLRKIYNAIKTEQYNVGVSEEIGFRIENPNVRKWSSLIEALTNVPTERLQRKVNNLEEAITGNHLMWQRVALSLGWSMWDIGVKDEELEEAKSTAKSKRKEKKKEEKKKEREDKGLKQVRCSATKSNGKRCGMTTYTDKKKWICVHHKPFKDGSDTDGDGKKEYRCTANKANGQRCKNKTENKNKKCYAHQ